MQDYIWFKVKDKWILGNKPIDQRSKSDRRKNDRRKNIDRRQITRRSL